jgi:hypothetical protein
VPTTPEEETAWRIIALTLRDIKCAPAQQIPISRIAENNLVKFNLYEQVVSNAKLNTANIYKHLFGALDQGLPKYDFIIPTLTQLISDSNIISDTLDPETSVNAVEPIHVDQESLSPNTEVDLTINIFD